MHHFVPFITGLFFCITLAKAGGYCGKEQQSSPRSPKARLERSSIADSVANRSSEISSESSLESESTVKPVRVDSISHRSQFPSSNSSSAAAFVVLRRSSTHKELKNS